MTAAASSVAAVVLAIQSPSQIGHDIALNWPIYLLMPAVAALIGYTTKIVAIEMMFKPVVFKGIKPYFGWQGIIPRNAARMASILCDTLTGRLISAPEIFGRLDAQRVAKEIEEPLHASIAEIAHAIAIEYQPGLWEVLPGPAKNLLIKRIQNASGDVIAEIMRSIQADIDRVFDLNDMVVEHMLRDHQLLERMFREVGEKEFAFIRKCGLWFGLSIGFVQVIVWALLKEPLIMPIFGLITGWFTDWLALKMIFNPKEPKKYLRVFTWQGMFLKRRLEVSAKYGEIIAEELLTPANLIDSLLRGPASDKLLQIIQRQVTELLNQQTGLARPIAVIAIGSSRYQQMKRDIARAVLDSMPETMKAVESYATDALDIHNTLVQKMQEMTVEEFENVLRPAFEQDEWKLIAVGAVLGFLVGELQVFIVEHLSRH